MSRGLLELIQARSANLQNVVDEFNRTYFPAVLTRYNSEFGPRYFGRPPTEPIPTEPRRLTEFRTRLGALIEYGLGVTLDLMLDDDFGNDLRLSFVVANQYPDFYVRDATGSVLLRIDCKLLHDESDEYSARFTLPVDQIQPNDDLLLYGAWQWRTALVADAETVYPHVLDALIVPAIEIAKERDRHLEIRGGRFGADGAPIVPPNWASDTNFGKINRIVHRDRRASPELSANVRAFLDFTQRHADAVRRALQEAPGEGPTEDELNPPRTT